MTGTQYMEPRSFVMPVVGLTTLALLGTSVPVAQPSQTIIVAPLYFGAHTATANAISGPGIGTQHSYPTTEEGLAATTTAEAVSELRSLTSFTWEQVAKLFGVSRRTVHLWAAGRKMSAPHQEQLNAVLGEARSISATTPPTQQMLFLSMLDRYRSLHRSKGSDINRPAETYAADRAELA